MIAAGYEHVAGARDEAGIALLQEALAMLPPGDGALRARCLAQLAGNRQPEPDMQPLVELAREAVAMARRIGDEETLRATMSAASFAMALFGDPAERKDVEGARPHGLAVDALVREFRHRRHQWLTSVLHMMAALGEGRFGDASRRPREALDSLAEDEARGTVLLAAPICIASVTERYDDRAALESQARAAFGAVTQPLWACLGEMAIAFLHGRAGDRPRASRSSTWSAGIRCLRRSPSRAGWRC